MTFEEMAAFFDARVDGYEAHMLKNVAGSDRFYDEMVRALPVSPGMRLLDLGCGTGLELGRALSAQPRRPGDRHRPLRRHAGRASAEVPR